MKYNKVPKRGSVRCAHSAGRAEDARPLAWRYGVSTFKLPQRQALCDH